LLQPCNKDLDRADSIVLSCYNTNLYSYLPQVVNPQRLSFPQIHLFFFLDPFSKQLIMSSIKLLPRPQSPTRKTNICMHLVCISFPLRRTCSYIPCIYILLHLPPSCQVVLLHALPQIITSHSFLFLFLSSFYFPPRAGCLFRKRAKATDHPGLKANLFISNYVFAFLICRCRLHLILLYMSFLALFNFCHSNSHHFSFTPSLSISHLFLCLPFS